MVHVFSTTLSIRQLSFSFFFNASAPHRDLHSFPHDALPIWPLAGGRPMAGRQPGREQCLGRTRAQATAASADRKSTRLNSSHLGISYAVFCLKKKKKEYTLTSNRHERTSRMRSTILRIYRHG